MSERIQEQLAQFNSRNFSERGKGLGKYVRDLYASGAKMYTKDMFHKLEADLAEQPRPKTTKIRSMNGLLGQERIPREDKEYHRYQTGGERNGILTIGPTFRIYQELLCRAEREDFPRSVDEDCDDMTLATRALVLHSTYYPASSVGYEDLKTTWDEASLNWTRSPVCKELIAQLAESPNIPEASKIVCFGLGGLGDPSKAPGRSAAPAKSDGLPMRSSMTQHAAAITMADVLGKRFGSAPLPILVQDPVYTSADKQLLAELGIEVARGCGSLAFTEVDNETIVFSVHPNIPVKQVIADIARPAVMIWNTVQPVEEERTEYYSSDNGKGDAWICSPWTTDQDSPRTRKLIEDYAEVDFPASERFGDLRIYIRKD